MRPTAYGATLKQLDLKNLPGFIAPWRHPQANGKISSSKFFPGTDTAAKESNQFPTTKAAHAEIWIKDYQNAFPGQLCGEIDFFRGFTEAHEEIIVAQVEGIGIKWVDGNG